MSYGTYDGSPTVKVFHNEIPVSKCVKMLSLNMKYPFLWDKRSLFICFRASNYIQALNGVSKFLTEEIKAKFQNTLYWLIFCAVEQVVIFARTNVLIKRGYPTIYIASFLCIWIVLFLTVYETKPLFMCPEWKPYITHLCIQYFFCSWTNLQFNKMYSAHAM